MANVDTINIETIRRVEKAMTEHINRVCGTTAQVSITGDKTFAVQGNKQDIEKIVAVYQPSNLVSVSSEYVPDLDLSCAWFELV